MKSLFGKVVNLKTPVLGKITFSRNIAFRNNLILVTEKKHFTDLGFAAVIVVDDSLDKEQGNVMLPRECYDDFSEGDVVYLKPDGEIVFWFEVNSNDNVIVATERCNHRCIMCPQPNSTTDIPDRHKLNLKLISLIPESTNRLCITGGEPSLIQFELVELVQKIKDKLPRTSLDILTNGTMFSNKSLAYKLAMCLHHDMQIDVPVFSDIPRLHNSIVGANTFYKTIEGIQNLALFHQQIGLRIVLHKLTYKRLPMLAEYIYRNFPFVAQVAFMGMETNAAAEDNIDEIWIDPYDYNEELEKAVFYLYNRGIRVFIYNAQLCVLKESLRPFAVQSISTWKNIFLEECQECDLKNRCCGLFESNKKWHSRHIKPLKDYENE